MMGVGFSGRADLIDLDGFSFELFVILKESAQHEEAVGRHGGGFAVGIELGILGRDRDDLVILFAGVDHGHQSDGASVDDGQRDDGFLTENKDIERIVVFGECLRNEAVIRWVVDSGIKNAIEANQAAGLVEFILHTGAERDFDHTIEFLGKFVARSHVVPRMDHKKKG